MRIIEDDTDPVAHLTRRFGNLLPDRQQDFDDIRSGDSPGWKIAQLRKGVAFEAGEPLARIDGAFPAGGILFMILARGFAECHLGGGFVFPLRKHIATVDLDRLAKLVGFLTRLRKRKQLGAP